MRFFQAFQMLEHRIRNEKTAFSCSEMDLWFVCAMKIRTAGDGKIQFGGKFFHPSFLAGGVSRIDRLNAVEPVGF